jgi:DME family drug/metabolite transporter
VTDRGRYTAALITAAVLFSTGGAAIKAVHLNGPQVACLRAAVASVAVALLLPESRRRWTGATLAVGLAYSGGMTLFVLANKLTTAANTIYLQAGTPLYILVLAPWLLREPAKRRDVALLGCLAVGLLLFFLGAETPVATAPDPVKGNVLAVLSGISIALMMIGLRALARHGDGAAAAPAVLAGNVIAFALNLPAAAPFPRLTVADVAILLFLGTFQIGVAYVLLTRALRHVPAFEASMLLMVEPALNPVWAWLVHGEVPSVQAIAGGVVILGVTTAKSLMDNRQSVPPGYSGRS